MKIAIASDHAGFDVKQRLRDWLGDHHEVTDFGPAHDSSMDYPDSARKVGHAVTDSRADIGVLLCATGIGMAIAANKIHGVRAATVYNMDTAKLARGHNNANIVCVGACFNEFDAIMEMVDAFLTEPFEDGRHARRVGKIMSLEDSA